MPGIPFLDQIAWSEAMRLAHEAVAQEFDPQAAEPGATHTGLVRCPICGDPLRWIVWHNGSLSVRCLGWQCIRFD